MVTVLINANAYNMKKNIAYLMISIVAVSMATSCKKYGDLSVAAPTDFNVTTVKQTYRVGDSIVFNFNTAPDEIIFYSGEAGKLYDNISRNIAAGKPKLVFQSNMTQGALGSGDTIFLYITSNLKSYDSLGVYSATWKDISSRNTKWPSALSTTFVTSDSIDLSDYNQYDSINLAFRIVGKQNATLAQRKWQIQNLTLTNFLPDGTNTPLFNTFTNTGWVQANMKNNPAPSLTATNYQAWNVGQAGINAGNSTLVIGGKACNSNGIPIATAYPITFDPSTAINIPDNDDWLITSPMNLKYFKPDVGVTVKNTVNGAFAGLNYVYYKTPGVFAQYIYKYTTPGVYNVAFVAQNFNNNNMQQVVQRLQITVTP
jgi:hypothetical protein